MAFDEGQYPMSSVKSLLFSHNHHLLSVKGCEAGLDDVLAFEGDEAPSQPFRYRIEFTSADHAHQQRDDADEGSLPDAAGAGGSGLRHQCSATRAGYRGAW